jgi:heme A synthase
LDQHDSGKPAMVRYAVMLLYVTIGIGMLRIPIEFQRVTQKFSAGSALILYLAVVGVMLFFIYKIGKGRNWARVTFLIMFFLGVPFSVGPLIDFLAANPLYGVLGITQAVIQFVAIALLCQKSSADWFRYMKTRPAS